MRLHDAEATLVVNVFRNIPFRQGAAIYLRHHYCTLKARWDRDSDAELWYRGQKFHGKEIKNKKDIHEKIRKVVYVGFSRPTHLLCLAVQKKTFLSNENAFADWKIIELQ